MSYAAIAEDKDKTLQDLIKRFLCYRGSYYRNCYSFYQPDQPWVDAPDEEETSPAQALYYASFGGLVNTVAYLLGQGADANAQGGYYGTALQAASSTGHEKVVELLLRNGANVNARGKYDTALHAASTKGNDKVVELLLANGANVNAREKEIHKFF